MRPGHRSSSSVVRVEVWAKIEGKSKVDRMMRFYGPSSAAAISGRSSSATLKTVERSVKNPLSHCLGYRSKAIKLVPTSSTIVEASRRERCRELVRYLTRFTRSIARETIPRP